MPAHLRLLTAFCLLSVALLSSCSSPTGSTGSTRTPPGVTVDLVPRGYYGRNRIRPMKPQYITIHATENRSRGGNAYAHAQMLKQGALKGPHNAIGYVAWHFTVDDHSIYQSLPTNERGEHADYDGMGNRSSIGIEMCENRGNSIPTTIDKTARLTAWLMKEHGIPISRVVPHMHWRMIRHDDHRDLGYKACPHFLLDRGRLGSKWNAFLARVEAYRRAL